MISSQCKRMNLKTVLKDTCTLSFPSVLASHSQIAWSLTRAWSSSLPFREHRQLDICHLRAFNPIMLCVKLLIVTLGWEPTLLSIFQISIHILQTNTRTGWKLKDVLGVWGQKSSNLTSERLILQLNIQLFLQWWPTQRSRCRSATRTT